jgi:7 transmembrane receptor (rhodopsin family)
MATYCNNISQSGLENSTNKFSRNFREFELPGLLAIGTYCTVPAGFIAIVLDVCLLVTFFNHRNLINPFTIHIINIIIIEVSFLCLAGPFVILRYMRRDLFHCHIYCNIYKYLGWTIAAMQLLQHCIICGDRWLALLAPVWYRQDKTIKMGIAATFCMLLYQQVWFLPMFTADAQHPMQFMGGAYCDHYLALPRYWLFVQIVTYFIPYLFLYVSYPALIFLTSKRRTSAKSRKF